MNPQIYIFDEPFGDMDKNGKEMAMKLLMSLKKSNKTNSSDFWIQMRNELNLIDRKYLYWYGDQVALKNLVKKSFENFDFVDEKLFACPPEYLDKKKFPFIVHFKGDFNKTVISNNINNIKNYLDVCEQIMKKNNSKI